MMIAGIEYQHNDFGMHRLMELGRFRRVCRRTSFAVHASRSPLKSLYK
jgi:hypothetical protein